MEERDQGLYVPTTDIFDVTYIQQLDVNTPEFKELIIRLQQKTNILALALNQKETSMYSTNEFLTSQIFYPDQALTSNTSLVPIYRQGYRKVIIFGALPNAGVKSVAHNIDVDDRYMFTRIYGVANDYISTARIPLPFASTVLNDNIEVVVDDTNVIITTSINYSSFTETNIILEYVIK